MPQDDQHDRQMPPKKKPLDLELEAKRDPETARSLEELERARSGGLMGRFNTALRDVLQTSRGGERTRHAVEEAGESPHVTADDLAIRRAKHVSTTRMVVPEGVIINGSMTSGSETEINGRIDGDVNVDGRLYLGPSALVSGNVRATDCQIEGLVEGKVECSQSIELGESGRLNADVVVGKRVTLAGHVFGNISTSGVLYLGASAKVKGNIQTRRLNIEEGATFNGHCLMRSKAQDRAS